MDLNKLKKQARSIEPVLRIGKNGINENVHTEVEKLLKIRKLVKVKILNNCPITDFKEIIESIVQQSQSKLILEMGNVFVIYRRGKKRV
jgi:RNA-binding protein